MSIELVNKDKQVYYDTFVLDPMMEVRSPLQITFDQQIYNNVPNGGVLILRI